MLDDEMLMEESALAAHNLIAPMLARRELGPLLQQLLSALHLGLEAIRKLRTERLAGQGLQRASAARSTAAVCYNLLQLVSGHGGTAAGAAAATGLSPRAASAATGAAAAGGHGEGSDANALERRLAALDFDLLRLLTQPAAAAAAATPRGAASPASAASSRPGSAMATPRNSSPEPPASKAAKSPPKGKRAASPTKGGGKGANVATAQEEEAAAAAAREAAIPPGGDFEEGYEAKGAVKVTPADVPEFAKAQEAVLAHPLGSVLGGPAVDR